MNVIEGGKPVDDIKDYVCAGMADVTVVVGSDAADVHAVGIGIGS